MSRVMDKPEDFTKLGVNPDRIEAWEDGRRDSSKPGHAEIWYLTKLAITRDGRSESITGPILYEFNYAGVENPDAHLF